MPGPAYIGEAHKRFTGHPDEVARWVPVARKVLGYAVEQAKFNGLMTYKVSQRTEEGVLLVGELIGGLPRYTIEVPSRGAPGWRRVLEGFYLRWAGAEQDVNPIIFTEPTGEEGQEGYSDWSALFYSADSYGRGAVPADRLGGSYRDVFGRKTETYGERLMHGNGMWTDPETDEVVAWMRGYNSYWPHQYRHPVSCYDRIVSIYGHTVYITPNTSRRVLAAAKKGRWLYVLECDSLGFIDPPPRPGAPTGSGQVWFAQPYTDAAYNYQLYRFPLAIQRQPDTGIESYTVVEPDEGGQLLWEGALALAYGAWAFNAEVTEVVTVQLPRVAVWAQAWEVRTTGGGDFWLADPAENPDYPIAEAQRIVLAIDDSGAEPSATLSMGDAFNLIAEENGDTLEIHPGEGDTYAEYRMGDFVLPVYQQGSDGGGTPPVYWTKDWAEHTKLVYAHLPSKTLLVHRWYLEYNYDSETGSTVFIRLGYHLYVNGEEVEIDDDSAFEGFVGPPSTFSILTVQNCLRRMYTAHFADDGVTPEWLRPMDAMTYLLGWTFGWSGAAGASTVASPIAPNLAYQSCPHIAFPYAGYPDAHAAAGGWSFGSVRGLSGHFWVGSAPGVQNYGASAGSYDDPYPSPAPNTPWNMGCVAHNDNVLLASHFQPLLAIEWIPGDPAFPVANQLRTLFYGSNGDAMGILEPLIELDDTRSFTMGHTGVPRRSQRGGITLPETKQP